MVSYCELVQNGNNSSDSRYIAVCVSDERQQISPVEMISLVGGLRVSELDGNSAGNAVVEGSKDEYDGAEPFFHGVIAGSLTEVSRADRSSSYYYYHSKSSAAQLLARPSVMRMYCAAPRDPCSAAVTCASVKLLGGGAGLASIILMSLTSR
jgi:hypothetical protein